MFIIDPMYVISFGVSKQILKKKGSLKLSIIDPFFLQKADVHVNHGNIDMLVTNRWDNRRVGLTFTYRFGNQNVKGARSRSSATSAEQGRMKGGN